MWCPEVLHSIWQTDSLHKPGRPLGTKLESFFWTLHQFLHWLFINSYTRGHIAPDGYANIFHITATGNECCSIGDRYPAFLTNRNGFIHFATQIGDRGNAFWDSPQLPPRVWYGIEAEQRFKNGKVWKKLRNTFFLIFQFSGLWKSEQEELEKILCH